VYPAFVAAALDDWRDAGVVLQSRGIGKPLTPLPERRKQSPGQGGTGARQSGEELVVSGNWGARLAISASKRAMPADRTRSWDNQASTSSCDGVITASSLCRGVSLRMASIRSSMVFL